ncbi:MAG: hypothetical protein ACOCX5_01785 [Chloroflexota bacterium]
MFKDYLTGPLLQISNTDSPTEILQDFLGQIPSTLIVMVCGAGLLLFVAFAWFAYFKPLRKARRIRREEAATLAATPASVPEPAVAATTVTAPETGKRMDTGELPELDLLLNPTTLKKELPEVEPDNITAAPPAQQLQDTSQPIRPANPRRTGRIQAKLKSGVNITADELLTVMRDPRDGRLVVLVGDTAYRSLVDAPEVKEQFVKIMRELSDVVMKPDDNPPETDTVQTPPPRTASAPPPPVSRDGAMPGDLPSYKLEDSLKPTRHGRYESTPLPSVNIAEAIEAYLQHKLKYTPEFNDRVIHVLTAPGGGVRIQVDDTYYEAVSDVEDEEIRAFLSETIAEWQSRQ